MDNLWRIGESIVHSLQSFLPLSESSITSLHSSRRPDLDDSEASVSPFPSLPRELVLRILLFTLPPPSSTSSARDRLLLEYSLFDKDCARWASLELWRDVHLPTPRTAKLFSDAIDLTRRKRCDTIKTLRIGQADVDEASMFQEDWLYADVGRFIERLFSVCSQVEELWIAGAKDLQLSCLSRGSNLRKLYLAESRVIPSLDPTSVPFHLPRLELLHLKSVICTGSTLDELLSPSSVPNLETLDFFSVHQSLVMPHQRPALQYTANQAPPNLQQLNDLFSHLQQPSPAVVPSATSSTQENLPPYHSIASQVKHLSLGPYSSRTIPLSAIPLFTSLISLSIPIGLFLSPLLAPIDFSPTLQALRITDAMTRSDEREQERNPVDLREQWELVKRKAEEVFGTMRSGREEVRSSSLQDPATRGDPVTDTVVVPTSDRTPSSLSVTLVSLDNNFKHRGNDISDDFEANIRGSKALRHDWDPNESRAERSDGAWEIGQERWRETLQEGGFSDAVAT